MHDINAIQEENVFQESFTVKWMILGLEKGSLKPLSLECHYPGRTDGETIINFFNTVETWHENEIWLITANPFHRQRL